MVLCIHNSDIMTGINSLYGSRNSPVDLYMQNKVIFLRNTSLCGTQPSSVVFACKTATFAEELQVSIGPMLRLWFCTFKTATLASELLISMGPSPHLWLLHAKQQLQDQNYKSLCVPTIICGFCMKNSGFRTRNTSLYCSQT